MCIRNFSFVSLCDDCVLCNLPFDIRLIKFVTASVIQASFLRNKIHCTSYTHLFNGVRWAWASTFSTNIPFCKNYFVYETRVIWCRNAKSYLLFSFSLFVYTWHRNLITTFLQNTVTSFCEPPSCRFCSHHFLFRNSHCFTPWRNRKKVTTPFS